MRKIFAFFAPAALVLSLWILGCSDKNPRGLVLFVVVDQLPANHIDRFLPTFSGGLRNLLENGIYVPIVRHAHALTVTAPGHATLITGTLPSRSGIVDNEWYDRQTKSVRYCVRDQEGRISPQNLLTPTYGEWLKKRYPSSRVFSVSGKDRGAVLLGGRAAEGAYWFSIGDGAFTSSTYYRVSTPSWLRRWNATKMVDRFFGTSWRPGEAVTNLPQSTAVIASDFGDFSLGFPHSLGEGSLAPNKRYYEDLYHSPFLDELTLHAAREIIDENKLGQGSALDFLGVSLSAMDTIGHQYGPHSPEVADALLRLDQKLGVLLSDLEAKIGKENLWVVLSSDHGVIPLPETSSGKVTRQTVSDEECIQRVGREIRDEFGPVLLDGCYLANDILESRGLSKEIVLRKIKGLLPLRCPKVKYVWSENDFRAAPADEVTAFWRKLYAASYSVDRSPDCFIQYRSDYLAQGGTGTTHGTPYSYDRDVPLLFIIPGRPKGTISKEINSVDIAPTLADLTGVDSPSGLDGRSFATDIVALPKRLTP